MLSPPWTLAAVGIGLASATGIYLLVLVSLVTTRRWWPPGDKTWSYYLHWMFVGVFNVSTLFVAVTDWHQWILPSVVSFTVGGALTIVGAAIFVRSAGVMQSDEVAGVTGELYTDGPYAYSRNPQYLGMIIGLVGFLLLTNSLYVTILAIAHIGWVLLLPRAEEAHLRDVYGHEYEKYLARVPRFAGRTTIDRLRMNRQIHNENGGESS